MIQEKKQSDDYLSIPDMIMSEIHFTNYCFIKASSNREYSISTLDIQYFLSEIKDGIFNSCGLKKSNRLASKNAQEYLEDIEVDKICFRVLLAVVHSLNKEYNVFKIITTILSDIFLIDDAKYTSEYLKDIILTIDMSINLKYELNNEHIILDTFNGCMEKKTIDILILKAEHDE